MSVSFLDVKALNLRHRNDLQKALDRVLATGSFILGAEVEAFEHEFAAYCGVQHCVGVGNGLDALHLVLRALGCPGRRRSHRSLQYLHRKLARCEIRRRRAGAGRTRSRHAQPRSGSDRERDHAPHQGHHAGPPVRSARGHGRHSNIANRHGLKVLEDAAQSHGARMHGTRAGAWAMPPASASIPARTSVRSAMEARSPPATRALRSGFACFGITGRKPSIATS